MDERIDKEVLEYMGIYKTKKPTEEKIKLGLKLKDEIYKLTKLKIERIYIMQDYAWGKNDDNPAYCFLTDVRIREIDENMMVLRNYAFKVNANILVWPMCQFEKRKNNPIEMDYYINNYGIKIYDTEKEVDIDERVKTTEYASKNDIYKFYYRYTKNNAEVLLGDLLRIYALKINYPANENRNLKQTIEYIKHISQDETILKYLEEFNKENSDKLNICMDLKKYIGNLKQIKHKMDLENTPTMKVYERFLEIKNKTGKLNISNLTKENLYTMEIVEGIFYYEIAKLFDIDKQEVLKMRKKFGFKVIDEIWYKDIEELMTKTIIHGGMHTYEVMKKSGLFSFEEHTRSILMYMKDGEKYLLKEFWKLIKGKRQGVECMNATTAKDVYFRAYLCMEVLKQNGYIEEVDFLKYRITKKGKDLLDTLRYRNIDELNLMQIANIDGEAKFYSLSIQKQNSRDFLAFSNPKQIEEVNNKEIQTNNDLIEVNFKDIVAKNVINTNRQSQTRRTKADYNKINISKEQIGMDSENKIYNLEKERLIKENREDLAKEVFWESRENGDGAGYDITSFAKKDGKYVEIYIEVKGTNKNINEPFDISKNEIDASNKYKEQYYIYRVSNIYSDSPKFYKINERIEDNFNLEATNFKARKK